MARYWLIMAAAGSGRRMASTVPKQYLQIMGKTVLEHSLDRLLSLPLVAGGVLVLAPDDQHWESLNYRPDKPLWLARGGDERAQSVFNGLQALATRAAEDDWVMVHDAARPCVRQADLIHLCESIRNDPVGGLLAVPVKDTLKQGDAALRVITTVDRSTLWQAQTPQVFRLSVLRQALNTALQQGSLVTDEASAIERLGLPVRLVAGHYDNIKITTQEDILLAEFYLSRQDVAAEPTLTG